jgi:radical SAM superfamily enzyme YgiQ (UPF0313 family)
MLELCNLLRDNPKSLDGLPGIKGLAFKKAGQSIDTADREYLDFDSLPFPARHLLPNNRYRMHPPFGIRPPLAIMETSRGCVYKCNFCGLFTSLRERSVPNIISEIEQLINKYKIKELHFVDPNFTYNQERLRDLCNALIKNRFGLAWSCKTRVDLVNPDLLGVMEKSGCYMISYGVESATQDRLDGLDKKITVNNTVDAFNWTRRHKIRSIAYVIIGYSEENDDSVRQLTAFINKINPDFVLYNEFLYVPGTPIVKQLVSEGKMTYKDLMDFYVSGKSINIPRTKVAKYLNKANRSFYFRFDYIFLRLMQIKNFQDFVNMLNGFRYFILDKIRLKNIF